MNKALQYIARQSGIQKGVKNVLDLFADGATIPFVARYRKEKTGGLDETQLEAILHAKQQYDKLEARKKSILESIAQQGKLNSSLQQKIEGCMDSTLLEDLYLPYKRKASTKASVAREQGLEPLANMLFWNKSQDPLRSARSFVKNGLKTAEDALQGARHIMSEMISEHEIAREMTREIFQRSATLVVKPAKGKKEEALAYKNYFDYRQSLKKIPSHRYLAVCRAEKEKLLSVQLEIDEEALFQRLSRYFKYEQNACGEQKALAMRDAMKRLLIPSIRTEFRKEAKSRADEEAIQVFAKNLSQLLLQAPLGEKRVLAIDPGFRTGCKWVALDDQANVLHHGTIYPHPPQHNKDQAKAVLQKFIHQYAIEAIAIGNGTAGRETMEWLSTWLKDIPLFTISESGASIYSASAIAREEFPHLDLTIRGAISIGRRLIDPLAELIKIDPKSIGIGQYQHDVHSGRLKTRLDQVVMNCVNAVGVNVNTASEPLLSYVSGLGPSLAQNIIDYRKNMGR